MLELLGSIFVLIIMVRAALRYGLSPVKWGAVTLGFLFASCLIPLPLFRVLIALAAAFVLMLATSDVMPRWAASPLRYAGPIA
jgi:hypothetical protein